MFGLQKTHKPALIVAGLGNPGKKYLSTRHNAGFLFLSSFARKNGCEIRKKQFDSLTGYVQDPSVLLLMPLTFMNLSGIAVHAAMKKYHLTPHEIVVVHDDMDLPVGRVKFHFDRSSAGHKGIDSIIEKLGSREFYRIRIGIGKPDHTDDTIDYVLSTFGAKEMQVLEGLFDTIADGLTMFISGERQKAMEFVNKNNGRTLNEKE